MIKPIPVVMIIVKHLYIGKMNFDILNIIYIIVNSVLLPIFSSCFLLNFLSSVICIDPD